MAKGLKREDKTRFSEEFWKRSEEAEQWRVPHARAFRLSVPTVSDAFSVAVSSLSQSALSAASLIVGVYFFDRPACIVIHLFVCVWSEAQRLIGSCANV